MASKNFCDICDKPAVGTVSTVADVDTPAVTLNHTENARSAHFQNNRMRLNVSWQIVNTYTDTVKAGHICADCLVNLLNQHIEQIKK